jgi:DNA processing protein
MLINQVELSPDRLLGPLNEVERKFVPKRLFVVGDTAIFEAGFRVSIVGSRKASPQGLRRAARLAKNVCERGGIVVSGLARGIDTAAHRAAIDAGGRTVAVIGTPLDVAYPPENRELQSLIMKDHICVSQFAFGTPVQPKNFPIRNRTMALLSDATVIIEAGEKSGSISQGWEALRLGRGLFISNAISTDSELKWPREMLAYGGQTLSDDSAEEFFNSLPERGIALDFDAIAVSH